MSDVRRRFPVPAAEVERRVFASADDDFMRLAVRIAVPIPSTRTVKNDAIRRSRPCLDGADIIANAAMDREPQTSSDPDEDPSDDGRDH